MVMRDDADILEEGFLPWQLDTARQWLGARERFAHAWLIHGMAGIGKMRFAKAAAVSLLCEEPNAHLACGRCQACVWLRHGNHPDFRVLRPEAQALAEGAGIVDDDTRASGDKARKAPSREIRVEQVRALETWVSTATHRGGVRVVLLYPAEALNSIAANALLKLLEEPPAGTIFLLVADAPDRLLPTLVSRCRRLPLPAPGAEQARQWLSDAGVSPAQAYLDACGGAPLAAWRLHQSGAPACPAWLAQWAQAFAQRRAQNLIPRLVDELDKQPAAVWLDALQRFFTDLLLVHSACPVRYYPGIHASLITLAERLPAVSIADAARWLASQQKIASHPLNSRLFIHSVLLRVTTIGLPTS